MIKSMTLMLFFGLMFSTVVWADVQEIDNTQLHELLAQNVPIIDIRRAEEWTQTGIVEDSHLLTFFDAAGNYDARAWLDRLEPIAGKEDPFILICRTGRRTGLVGQFLDKQLGYKKVYNVKKGITHWIDQKNPVVAP